MNKDTYYILETSPQWYTCCITKTHFCFAAGSDLTTILNKVFEYTKRYRTEERLLSAMEQLDSKGTVCEKTYEQRSRSYEEQEHLPFAPLIEDTVVKALEEAKKDTPFNRVKKRLVGVAKTNNTTKPPVVNTHIGVHKKITPRRIVLKGVN